VKQERGYSLVEMLVSTAVMMVVVGGVFTIVNPARGTSRVQPEFADLQQRARVGADTLFKDLVMAGAGPYQGTTTGSLAKFFAPIVPYKLGRENPDPPRTFRSDALTIVYVPNTSSQTFITQDMPNESVEIKVDAQPNCPLDDPLCGFTDGMSVLIFDENGAYESFEITEVQSDAMHMQHRGQRFQRAYGAGTAIVQAEWSHYYWDSTQLQLRRYDGISTDVPILDNVVGLTFTYFGDPNPPRDPKPVIGEENCLFDASGNPTLPVLTVGSGALSQAGSLVEIDPAIFREGALCPFGADPEGTNVFDADLYRIRKIGVTLRVQASDPTLRLTDTQLFARPGTGRAADGFVPAYELRFEVSPRNLNLMR
jgi:hypothetical protein